MAAIAMEVHATFSTTERGKGKSGLRDVNTSDLKIFYTASLTDMQAGFCQLKSTGLIIYSCIGSFYSRTRYLTPLEIVQATFNSKSTKGYLPSFSKFLLNYILLFI